MNVLSSYFRKLNTKYTLIQEVSEIEDTYILGTGEVIVLNDGVHNEKCRIGDGTTQFSQLPWFADVSEVTTTPSDVRAEKKFVNKTGERATGTLGDGSVTVTGGNLTNSATVEVDRSHSSLLTTTTIAPTSGSVYIKTTATSTASRDAITKKTTSGIIDTATSTVSEEATNTDTDIKYCKVKRATLPTPVVSSVNYTTHEDHPSLTFEVQEQIGSSSAAQGIILTGDSSSKKNIQVYLSGRLELDYSTGTPMVTYSMTDVESGRGQTNYMEIIPASITVYVSADMTATQIANAVNSVYSTHPGCKVELELGTKLAADIYSFKYGMTAPTKSCFFYLNGYTGASAYQLGHTLSTDSVKVFTGYQNTDSTTHKCVSSMTAAEKPSIEYIDLYTSGYEVPKVSQGYMESTWTESTLKSYLKISGMGSSIPYYAVPQSTYYWSTGYVGPGKSTGWIDAIQIPRDTVFPKAFGDWILANTTH